MIHRDSLHLDPGDGGHGHEHGECCDCPACLSNAWGDGEGDPDLNNYEFFYGKWSDGTSAGAQNGGPGGVVTWSIMGAGIADVYGGFSMSGTTQSFDSITSFDYMSLVRQAFDDWSSHGNIEFVQVADGGGAIGAEQQGEIRIGTAYIDGGSGILGQGYSPGSGIGGDIILDSSENWHSHLFYLTVLHEIGHAIGLGHETSNVAVMNPYINLGLAGLQSDDQNGAAARYGAQDNAPSTYALVSSDTDFTVMHGPNDLVVVGNNQNNTLTGSDRRETLNGGNGNDVLDGGGGVDTLLGGAGNDRLVFDALDSLDGGADFDTLVVRGGSAPTGFNLASNGFEAAEHEVTDTGSNPWASYTDTYDAIWQRLSQDGLFDDGRTWQTDWDVAGAQAWSEKSDYFTSQGAIYEQTGTFDDGRTWQTLWDTDNSQPWASQVTYNDAQNDHGFVSHSDRYDSQGRLYEQVGTLDDGWTWHNRWDVDGSQPWALQSTMSDTADAHSVVFFTDNYNDLNQIYEQTGAFDDSRTWQTLWDIDNAESWLMEITYQDTGNSYSYQSHSDRYDDLSRLYEQVGTYDDGLEWQNVWDLDDTEVWASRTVLTDASDLYAWHTQTYEFDASNNLINFVVVDDGAFV